jgi:elongation factor Ts
MHVAAAGPRYLERGEVAESILDEEREIARAQAVKSGKPENILDRIVKGKVEKFYSEHVLLEQAYVKEPEKTVGQLITDAVNRMGENIRIRRFARFVLGAEDA